MRGLTRRRAQDEEEESAFVSMTDMTVSFLFIVILLLAFFASKYSEDDTVPRMIHDRVVTERNTALQERDVLQAERDQLVVDLQQSNDALEHARVELSEALAEIERLRQRIVHQDARIAELEEEATHQKERIAKLEEKVARLEERIAELEALLNRENPLEQYSADAARVRRSMLDRLAAAVQAEIDAKQIDGLTVSAQGDALRFQGSGLFASGARSLTGTSLEIVRSLGTSIAEELPCYSVGSRSAISSDCNPDLVLFETIQVEGHTDSVGPNAINLDLSTGRALSAFNAIAPDRNGGASEMLEFQNLLGQPILAVAGYGEMRPIVDEATGDRSANRRIDLRFIMYVPPGIEFIPETVDDIGRVRDLLRQRVAER